MQRIYSLLLVDDEEASRLLLTRRLEQEGYIVTGATGGQVALDMMRVEHFDLVLLDMNMPVMNGLATLDVIKSDPLLRETTVVMLTASSAREHVIHCLALGAADYLIKPANPVELKQRLRLCLDKKAVRPEPTLLLKETDLTGSRILIVDDEPLNVFLLEKRLSQMGFKSLSAEGGLKALELLESEHVDAILLDVNMPDMNGAEVLRAIRTNERWRSLPVLMLSADDEHETIENCYQLGANDYLVKPYQTHDLNLRLAVAMEIGRTNPT